MVNRLVGQQLFNALTNRSLVTRSVISPTLINAKLRLNASVHPNQLFAIRHQLINTRTISKSDRDREGVNPLRFKDKTVIVTGGASGIGRAVVEEFSWEGAHVAIFDINQASGEELASTLLSLGRQVQFYHVDVTDQITTRDAVEHFVFRNHNKLHFLINNAVYFGSKGLEAAASDFEKSFSVNATAAALMVQACSKYMIAARADGCAIVNNASISGHIAQPMRWTYSATKGALLSMTRCMALDLGVYGIRVNSVSPAWIWTPEVAKAAQDGGRSKWEPIWANFHMLRRIGNPHEVARAILFLCSSDASFITGTDLPVDGGYLSMSAEGLGAQSKFAGCE